MSQQTETKQFNFKPSTDTANLIFQQSVDTKLLSFSQYYETRNFYIDFVFVPVTSPVNTVLPSITGGTAIGDTLTGDVGSWTYTPPIVYTYEWYNAGVLISGETSLAYVVRSGDSSITFKVTATASGSTSAESSAHLIPSLPSITSSTFAESGGELGGGYTYSGAIAEANQPPVVTSVSFSGTLQQGLPITFSFEFKNNSGYSGDNHELKIYRATDQHGTAEALVTTLNSDTTTFPAYTLAAGEALKYVIGQVTARLAGAYNTDSDTFRSVWTGQIAAGSTDYPLSLTGATYTFTPADVELIYGSVFQLSPATYDFTPADVTLTYTIPTNVFDRVWGDISLVASDWNTNSAAVWSKLTGSAADAVQNGAAPQLVSSSYLEFITANSTRIQQKTGSPQVSQGFEVWLDLDVTSTSGTQSYWAGSNTIFLRIVSGFWTIGQGGTAQTTVAASTGRQAIRVQFNGASSFIQINSGTKTTVPATPGTSLPASDATCAIGSNFALTGNYAAMKLYARGIRSTAMTDLEATTMFTYLGH